MKRIPKSVGISFLLLIVGGVLCLWFRSSLPGSWNYKVTVTVETPEGIKTGSSVWEMDYHWEPNILPGVTSYWYMGRGEAVIVDLGKRGLLFGLLTGSPFDVDNPQLLGLRLFPLKDKTPIGTEVHLIRGMYPLFVTFSDLNNPKTVKSVFAAGWDGDYPIERKVYVREDNTERVLGSGVRIKDVTFEITKDSPTQKIAQKLPWLAGLHGQLSGKRGIGSNQLVEKLSKSDFYHGKL